MTTNDLENYYPFACDCCSAQRRYYSSAKGWTWASDPDNTSLVIALCADCTANPDWRGRLRRRRAHFHRLMVRRRAILLQRRATARKILEAAAWQQMQRQRAG